MPKSKILNKSTHSAVSTSADVSIGFAEPEDVVKHIKVQGARKRSRTKPSVLSKMDNAMMPSYQASADYDHFWATFMNPFMMNQLQWELSMFRSPAATRPGSDVRKVGLTLSKGCIPLKATDSHGLLSSSNLTLFGSVSDQQIRHPTVGSSRTTQNDDVHKALSLYEGLERYSEVWHPATQTRESLIAQTNNLDVAGNRQGVQVFWLNDKHTRRERQAKAAALGKSITQNDSLGISQLSGPKDADVYVDPNWPDIDVSGEDYKKQAIHNHNTDYDLEHDMMELTYHNTSNDVVYLEFIEYEPQQGATGPLEYYNEWCGEVGGDAVPQAAYNSENLITPIFPTEFDVYNDNAKLYPRHNYCRLHEIQPGLSTRLTYVGTVAKDPEGRGDLSSEVLAPNASIMAMTTADSANNVGTFIANQAVPFARNPQLGLMPLTTEQDGAFSPKAWTTQMACAPGVFCHQTVDQEGAQFPLSCLGTKVSGQSEGDNIPGYSSWRPVNMMNLSPTMNPNTDLHLGIERYQDTSDVVKHDTGQFIGLDGNVTSDATQVDADGNTVNLSPLQKKMTARRCFSTRTETHDARLLLPNTGNEFIKLWREDLYDEVNRESNGGKRRPFGSSLNSHEKSMQQLSVYDQVSDQWLMPGERPTGRAFSSMYHQKKKTRVMVEPNSIISYQFFADPGVDGESRLLNSDLLKENYTGLFNDSDTAVNSLMNFPGDEFTEKVLGQNQFFDQRSRVCMVFANGAPVMKDGVSVTKPVSVNYTIKTLEKVRYLPKFYDKMQRLTHAKPLAPGFGPKFYDSDFISSDESAHLDARKQETIQNLRSSSKITGASKRAKEQSEVTPVKRRSVNTELNEMLTQVNDRTEHYADVAGKGVTIMGNVLKIANGVYQGYKLGLSAAEMIGPLAASVV